MKQKDPCLPQLIFKEIRTTWQSTASKTTLPCGLYGYSAILTLERHRHVSHSLSSSLLIPSSPPTIPSSSSYFKSYPHTPKFISIFPIREKTWLNIRMKEPDYASQLLGQTTDTKTALFCEFTVIQSWGHCGKAHMCPLCLVNQVWLILFNIMISSFIHFPVNVKISSSCDRNKIPLNVLIPYFPFPSSVDRHLGWGHVLAAVTSATASMGM